MMLITRGAAFLNFTNWTTPIILFSLLYINISLSSWNRYIDCVKAIVDAESCGEMYVLYFENPYQLIGLIHVEQQAQVFLF